MRAHSFVVDRFSFPVHRSRGFCGVKNPEDMDSRLSLYADLGCIRRGDLVFFYHRRTDESRLERGHRGIFRVISEPFFDDTDIEWQGNIVRGKCPRCGSPYSEKESKCPSCKAELAFGEHILPNRVLIEPVEYYEKPVDDNTAYINHTNHGMLWTLLLRKIFGPGRERSVTPILPEEAEKLLRLLRRVNENRTSSFPSAPYPSTKRRPITINLGNEPRVPFENTLVAWMTRNIDKDYPVLREVIGPKEELEFFGNHILYGIGGEKVDFLCLHKRDDRRYKATVIELKKDAVDERGVEQIEDYSYWIAQLSTANLPYAVERFFIQPVLLGYRITQGAQTLIDRLDIREFEIPYQTPTKVTIYRPIVMTYRVSEDSICFEIKQHMSRGSVLDYI